MDIDTQKIAEQIKTAIAQCLNCQDDLTTDDVIQALDAVTEILKAPFDTLKTQAQLATFTREHSLLWDHKIGLVYGGATKIKQYVFESADLQEIRGASALLDRINLVDLPAFFQAETEAESDRFRECRNAASYCRQIRSSWLHHHFPSLEDPLTPEMVIYSTGGNILAFCPAGLVDELANAIEKRYTTETLTANACAVGNTFSPLEVYLGLLVDPIENTLWLDTIESHKDNPAFRGYFGLAKKKEKDAEVEPLTPEEVFKQGKGFSELAGKLANQFNQRRSGYDPPNSSRPSRRYPPMFETHPYLMRDDSDRRSAVAQATLLPDAPNFSEPTARKRRVGQITKRDKKISGQWYVDAKFQELWDPLEHTRGVEAAEFRSWVSKFEEFLVDPEKGRLVSQYDKNHRIFDQTWRIVEPYRREARSLTEIGAASNGFVGYIYADGNNMGQHIREKIHTPEDYRQFSKDIFAATVQSVYWALAQHIRPFEYTPDAKSPRDNKDPVWIHPFEIITIGGDDVLIIVPANKALEIAHSIGEKFEEILAHTERYALQPSETNDPAACHRYQGETAARSQSRLSISSGVLITAVNTPIYYADKLVTQLLKSAKKRAKDLKEKGYFGGTVDFLTLKAVTMISSNIESFRNEGLTVRFPERQQELKLYAAPYTLHELKGLIETVRAVKESGFPRSQLYQIRSLLEQGKRTAILNYRYFRVRLQKESDRALLKEQFEDAWCKPLDENNPGSLAPWMTLQRKGDADSDDADPDNAADQAEKKTVYETLWRELVELYDFITEHAEPEPLQETSSLDQDQEVAS